MTRPPEREATLRILAMPADVNVNGDIFGGWVLSQMDVAGGVVAGERAQGRVATVALDAMKFIRPVRVGDLLCVYAAVQAVGRTSITISVEAWAVRNRIGEREKVTEAKLVFVAIDETGRKRPVPTP